MLLQRFFSIGILSYCCLSSIATSVGNNVTLDDDMKSFAFHEEALLKVVSILSSPDLLARNIQGSSEFFIVFGVRSIRFHLGILANLADGNQDLSQWIQITTENIDSLQMESVDYLISRFYLWTLEPMDRDREAFYNLLSTTSTFLPAVTHHPVHICGEIDQIYQTIKLLITSPNVPNLSSLQRINSTLKSLLSIMTSWALDSHKWSGYEKNSLVFFKSLRVHRYINNIFARLKTLSHTFDDATALVIHLFIRFQVHVLDQMALAIHQMIENFVALRTLSYLEFSTNAISEAFICSSLCLKRQIEEFSRPYYIFQRSAFSPEATDRFFLIDRYINEWKRISHDKQVLDQETQFQSPFTVYLTLRISSLKQQFDSLVFDSIPQESDNVPRSIEIRPIEEVLYDMDYLNFDPYHRDQLLIQGYSMILLKARTFLPAIEGTIFDPMIQRLWETVEEIHETSFNLAYAAYASFLKGKVAQFHLAFDPSLGLLETNLRHFVDWSASLLHNGTDKVGVLSAKLKMVVVEIKLLLRLLQSVSKLLPSSSP